MTSRERIRAVLDFQPPDLVGLEIHPSTAGLYEHGERLQRLLQGFPHDFGDFSNLALPTVNPDAIQPDGSYCETRTDAWGITWKHYIFGAWGIPEARPLDDWTNLDHWQPPAPPSPSGPDYDAARANAAAHKQKYYLKAGWGGFFEQMHSLRRFEDVLMEIALNTREINRLADMLVEYESACLGWALGLQPDGIGLGADFGTQEALLLSRDQWRRFFRPRYEKLLAPVREQGCDIFFHSCGQISDLLPDLADLGINAVWPQINLYDWPTLARRCRELRLALALHPERSHVMTSGTPEQVRRHVDDLATAFVPQEGGSWFYLEIDNGFPWENIEALFEAVARYR